MSEVSREDFVPKPIFPIRMFLYVRSMFDDIRSYDGIYVLIFIAVLVKVDHLCFYLDIILYLKFVSHPTIE